MEILELKYKISELKNLLDAFIANWTMQEKKTSKIEEMAIQTIQTDKRKEQNHQRSHN